MPNEPSDEYEFPDCAPIEGAVSQSVTRQREEARAPLKPFSFEDLKDKQVEVWARGFRYRGKLSGADENDLYLKGLTRWWVIPLADISRIREE